MTPADNPTSAPVLEETAPVAPSVPEPAEELPPLGMEVTYGRGQVLLAFSRHIAGVHMTPKVTRQLIRQLSKAALEADRYKPGQKA